MKTRYLKPAIFLVCLLPLARLAWKELNLALGANPIQVITFSTGTWTLVLLLATLSITPLRNLSRQYWLIRYRRMLGLFAFFYGCLHFLTYLWLDRFFDRHSMSKDLGKRPFIAAGFTAFLLMVPLAVTSTQWAIRKLGKRWQLLHRLIYLSAAAGVVHYIWLVKRDVRTPLIFAVVLGALLLYRLMARFLSRASNSRATLGVKQAAAAGD